MRLSECILDHDFIYLVRPFRNSGSLCQALKRENITQLTEKEMRAGTYSICQALNTIHSVGFLHGDVRPQHIFLHSVGKKMKIKLGEYDKCCPIEKKAEQQPHDELNKVRLLYLAPEAICTQERGITPASEVWSLGVTLFVLATGCYPFASAQEICEADLTWPTATILSHKFKLMITSMLQKD